MSGSIELAKRDILGKQEELETIINKVSQAYVLPEIDQRQSPKPRQGARMHMPPANRSMDVKDINGVYKKNRFGARLSVDPEAAKQFAGTRRDSSGAVIRDQTCFIKHKNDSEAFSHLGNKQTLYRKSVQRLPNIEYHSVNRPSPARVNP